MAQTVCIDFCDFHPNFRKTDNYYYHTLRQRFDLQICDQPDFLFFGAYGHEHRLHSGFRILLSWEQIEPDYRVCDYSVSGLRINDPRHLQLPYYVLFSRAEPLVRTPDEKPEQILASKRKFCSILLGKRCRTSPREAFLRRFLQRHPVDSAGRYLNNVGAPVPGGTEGKIAFLRDYKFNLAFENQALPGWTTEKIVEPMAARCVPVYWGNPDIAQEFNPRSFLNYADFPSEDALIDRLLELDRDDARYLEYLRQPYFHHNVPNAFFDPGRVIAFFERVFNDPGVPVAQRYRRRSYFFGRWIAVKRHNRHPLPARSSAEPKG